MTPDWPPGSRRRPRRSQTVPCLRHTWPAWSAFHWHRWSCARAWRPPSAVPPRGSPRWCSRSWGSLPAAGRSRTAPGSWSTGSPCCSAELGNKHMCHKPSYLSGCSSTYAIFFEGHDHVIFQQCSQLLGKLHLGHRLQGGFRHTVKKGGRHSLHSHSTGAGAHPPVGSPQKDGRLLRHGSPNDAQRNQRFPQHRAGFAYFGGGLMETKENEKCISKEPRRTQEALKTNRKVN